MPMNMRKLYSAIHRAVLALRDAEKKNWRDGLHHRRGRTDKKSVEMREECYDRRADWLCNFSGLLDDAVPAGIEVGFGGETVMGWLDALMASVDDAAYWDTTFEGAADDDVAAYRHRIDLFVRVSDALAPLKIVADVAAARTRPVQEERLLFDRDTLTVTLDRKEYPELDPTAFSILEEVWKGQGKPVSGKTLSDLPGMRGKNIPREIKKLPEDLRAIVKGGTGSGRWISLPPKTVANRP
jgi:hypothetical protein